MYKFLDIKQDTSILNNIKHRDKVELSCDHCGSSFFRNKRNILISIKRGDENCMCSLKCTGLMRTTKNTLNVTCNQCGKEMTRTLSSIGKNNFCNHTCAATYSNQNKTHGTRVSKLEKFIQEKLPLKFPNLEIHYNCKDAINSELDIYIPSFKLAIELNGIFHYEPIYGSDKLSQIQNNDTRKIQACIERGIEFCIIDISKITYLKESTALPILKIIEDLINLKLAER